MSGENGNGNGSALAKSEPRETVLMSSGVLKPESLSGLWRLAGMVWNSGLVPNGIKNQEQVAIMLAAGFEIGLSPMQSLSSMMVVNNRPSIWGDAALALAQGSGELEDIEETIQRDAAGKVTGATCRVKRKGRPTQTVRSFTVEDAKAAKLWDKELYNKYPARMLQMRARAFALRDSFPDVLRGVGVIEEQQDVEPARSVAAAVAARLVSTDDAKPEKKDAPIIDAEPAADTANNGGSSDQTEPDAGSDEPMLTTRGEQGGLPGIDMSGAAASMRGKR